jgi:hypothetical protein
MGEGASGFDFRSGLGLTGPGARSLRWATRGHGPLAATRTPMTATWSTKASLRVTYGGTVTLTVDDGSGSK